MSEDSTDTPTLMDEFGSDLRRAREARKVALEEIAQGTKISVRHLRSLEDDQFAELPGGVFNKGIVRAYVRFLGLDETEWLNRYDTCPGVIRNDADWAVFAENVRRNRIAGRRQRDLRWLGIVAMVLVLAVCGWLVWRYVVHPRTDTGSGSSADQGSLFHLHLR